MSLVLRSLTTLIAIKCCYLLFNPTKADLTQCVSLCDQGISANTVLHYSMCLFCLPKLKSFLKPALLALLCLFYESLAGLIMSESVSGPWDSFFVCSWIKEHIYKAVSHCHFLSKTFNDLHHFNEIKPQHLEGQLK